MQATRKLVLHDEFDREYKRLQRPVAAFAKTDHSLQLSKTLRGRSLSVDRKVKEYVGALHRYLNVDDQVAGQPNVKVNWTSEPIQRVVPRVEKKNKKRPNRTQWEQY
jgi:hypothetical protein